jgi:hypothetical protein
MDYFKSREDFLIILFLDLTTEHHNDNYLFEGKATETRSFQSQLSDYNRLWLNHFAFTCKIYSLLLDTLKTVIIGIILTVLFQHYQHTCTFSSSTFCNLTPL